MIHHHFNLVSVPIKLELGEPPPFCQAMTTWDLVISRLGGAVAAGTLKRTV